MRLFRLVLISNENGVLIQGFFITLTAYAI